MTNATEYLRAIVDCLGDPVFVKDRHHRLVFVNDAACAIFGKRRGQLMGRTDHELFPKEHADLFRKADEFVFETGEENVDEEQITDAQGHARRIVTKRTLWSSKAGEKYLIGTIRDITERTHAEEALLESEVKYRTVVENSLAGVYIYQDNLFRFVNKQFCEIYGYTCEEIVNKLGAMDVTHPKERHVVQEHVRELMTGSLDANRFTHTAIRKDGGTITVYVLGSRMIYGGRPAISGTVYDITEQRRSERELRQKTALLEAQVNASLDGIIVVDRGRKILQNQQVNELLKIPRHIAESDDDKAQVEWVGGLARHPEQFHERVAYMLARQSETLRGELELKEGTVLDTYSSPVIGKDGKHYGRIWTFRDITERKRSEAALRASRLHLSEAMDLAHIVYWEFDLAAQAFVLNDPFYAFYGTTAGQEGGYLMTREEYARRFIHPDDQLCYHRFVEQSTSKPGPESVSDVEHRIIRRDGEVRHILARVRIVKDDSGHIVKRYGANQDITGRKQMEKAVQEREEQFRKIFEGSPLGMVMAGADFRIIRANEAFCRMLGYTEQELASFTFTDITHPEDIAEDALLVDDLVSGKIQLYRTEKRYIRKNKEVVWGSVTRNIMRGRDDRFLYFLITVEDITQRKQSEEERRHLESQLRQAQKMDAIGTLAGGIAHDFNNMLAVIIGNAELALDEVAGIEGPQRNMEQIVTASKRARDLVKQILTFSRKTEQSTHPLKLSPLIEETCKLLRGTLPSTIRMKFELQTESDIVSADPTQMEQVLMNLATNAAHAMSHGGGVLTFTLSDVVVTEDGLKPEAGMSPGRYVKLGVLDTGTGMTDEVQRRIFEPFFTTKEAGRGTGMGLAVVYGIVKGHKGVVTVESEPGRGSVFNVFLPLVEERIGDRKEEIGRIPGGRERILLVDDEPAVLEMTAEILERLGYDVATAGSGVDAWSRFTKDPYAFDLVLTDQIMPVILFTGYSEAVSPETAKKAGITEFLTKPLVKREVAETVRRALDSRSLVPRLA
jgi:PAS domain S-box-containing protein